MKQLVIVQNVPTQFDVPLYNIIGREKPFNLRVVYSQSAGDGVRLDPETGLSPAWDHITEETYERIDLSANEQNSPGKVSRIVAESQPDHVLLSGYYPPLHRKLVKPLRRQGFSLGLRSDNTLPHSNFSGLKGIAKKILLPGWLGNYDIWHPVGSLAADYLRRVSGVEKPVVMFPYNVDNQWLDAGAEKARKQRAEHLASLGFPEDALVILGILKWHRREDPLCLVEAFKRFSDKEPRARLILVGDGPLKPQVYEGIGAYIDKVHLPGYVSYSQLPHFYGLADVFVHPAPDEPWGVSVNEALACGVPVIASSGVGSVVDLVEEGVTGYSYAAGDVDALLGRMETLFGQMSSGAGFAAACRNRMSQWNYDTTIAGFSAMLDGLN